MALPHQLAGLVVIFLAEQGGELGRARDLADDMPRTPKDLSAQFPVGCLDLLHGHIPQRPHLRVVLCKERDRLLALFAALGVLPAAQLVLHQAVDDHHAQLVGIDRHELFGEIAAVQQHRRPRFGRRDDRLIHDAHRRQRIFMFGLLAQQGEPLRIHRQPGQRQQASGRTDQQRRAARQPAAHRQRITDQAVYSRQRDSGGDQLGHHAARIVRPRRFPALDFSRDIKLDDLSRERRRRQPHPCVLATAADEADLGLDRHRKDEPVVVVRVFPDEIDPPRRADDVCLPLGRTEGFGEFLSQLRGGDVHAPARA